MGSKHLPTPVDVFREAEIPLFAIDDAEAEKAWWLFYRANRELQSFLTPWRTVFVAFLFVDTVFAGVLIGWPTTGFLIGSTIISVFLLIAHRRTARADRCRRDYMNWVHMVLREPWSEPWGDSHADDISDENTDPY